MKEIGEDLRSPHPMTRLLQGDVGSGKTIVALLTLLVAVENGHQGALMAPTEILAEQHFRNLSRILADAGDPCRLVRLTGSVRGSERRAILGAIAAGQADVAVGTHALFEEGVSFRSLGPVVVDEQHRFGVLQRAALACKVERPDVLVMTATPIPGSLALTVYGDLDVSVIDEMPPGRMPVETRTYPEPARPKVYRILEEEVRNGRQAFIVYPLEEESEKLDLKDATRMAEHLQRASPWDGG